MTVRFPVSSVITITMLFLIVSGNSAAAQTNTFHISGTVTTVDDNAEEPLTGATIRLLALPDSVMVRGTTSGADGTYMLRNVQPGNYLLAVSYIGYQTAAEQIEEPGQNLDGLDFTLRSVALELDEFQITARRPRVEVRGDTTAFHADGYRTNRDATAEQLVTRMPGFSIEDGRLQAQGEEVRRVLVDGREFFGDDATLTLRNLPSDVIQQIEVFDRLSDQAQFTGFNDGNTERTLNVVTRRGMNNGHFGRATSGLGTETRYSAGGNYNYFDTDRRISLIGMSNNVNQQNFSNEDLLGVAQANSGGGRGGGGGGFRRGRGGSGGPGEGGGNVGNFMVGNQNGISSVHSTGINYIDKWNDSWDVSGSYFFNLSNNINDQNLERRYLSGISADQIYDEEAYDTSENANHRFNMRMEYTIDERRSLIITPRMSYQQNNRNSLLEGLTFVQGANLLNQIQSENRLNNSGYDISNTILYRHRYETSGRTFSANLRTDLNDRTGDRFQFDESQFFGDDENIIVNNQQTETITGGYTISANLSFTEPITERSQLMMSYQPSLNRNSSIQDAFLFDEATGRYDILETALSNRYENQLSTHRLRGSYRFRGERYNADLNLGWQYTGLAGEQIFPHAVETTNSWQNLLPGASFQYRFENNSSIRLSYNTNTQTPLARQLQNVVDNSNPLRMTAGNPDLGQQYDHRFSVRLRAANPENGTSTMAFVSMNYTMDYLGSRTFTAPQDMFIADGIQLGRGGRLITPENIGNSWNIRSFLFHSMPVDLIKSNLNLNGGISYSRIPSYIDDNRNIADNIGLSAGSVISSNISENIDFNFSYRANYNIVENSINPLIDSNYYIGRVNSGFNLMPWRGLVLSSDLNFQHYEGLSEDFSRNTLYWNGAVAYKFLENRAAELRLHLFDILAQNNNINRSFSEDYIEDYQTNVLSRYFLMTFSYNFRSFAGNRSGL